MTSFELNNYMEYYTLFLIILTRCRVIYILKNSSWSIPLKQFFFDFITEYSLPDFSDHLISWNSSPFVQLTAHSEFRTAHSDFHLINNWWIEQNSQPFFFFILKNHFNIKPQYMTKNFLTLQCYLRGSQKLLLLFYFILIFN